MGNFKKMVRERMAKTGESWQTAQRHVRAKAQKKPKTVAYPLTTCWDCGEEWEQSGPEGLTELMCPRCGAPNVPGGYKQRKKSQTEGYFDAIRGKE